MSDLVERLQGELAAANAEIARLTRELGRARQGRQVAFGEVERLRARVHTCPDCGEECVECQCMRKEIERLRGALLCGHCGGSGWITLGVADTAIPCSYCAAHKIRQAAKAGGE